MKNIKNLCHKYGLKPNSFKIIKLRGDASDRKIYRIEVYYQNSIIAIEGNNINENDAFLEFTNIFKDNNFNVPKILQISDDRKYYLLEDLGNITVKDQCDIFYKENKFNEIKKLYTIIIKKLPQIQITLSNKINYNKYCYQYEEFNKLNMLEDIKLFKEYYLTRHKKEQYSKTKFNDLINNLLNDLSKLSDTNPKFFLYRDFQTRNIMLKDINEIYFIDYQSGRKGLPFYDLASFLYSSSSFVMDSKLNNLEEKLIDIYISSFKKNLITNKDLFNNETNSIIENLGINNKEKFKKYLYSFGIIRIMQAIGRYYYLYEERNKKEYIAKAPKALKTLKYLIDKYSQNEVNIW